MKNSIPQQPTRVSTRITNCVYASRRRTSPSVGFKPKDSPARQCLRRTSSHTLAAQVQRQRAVMQLLAMPNVKQNLTENEYRAEIHKYMKTMEVQTMGHFDAVNSQPELSWEMRPILIDFLVEVHFARRLRPETLYLAINLLDRYLSKRVVLKKHYQLVGCAALWIAAKFEDAKDAVPSLEYLTFMSGDAYDHSHFVQMEYHILSTLDFALGHPSAENWLRFGLETLEKEDSKVQSVARCVMEVSLYHGDFLEVTSSAVAEGAIILARAICRRPPSIFEESEQAVAAAELIDFHLGENLHHLSETLIKKYSYACYHAASTIVVDWYQAGHRYSSASRSSSPTPSFACSSMIYERSTSCTPSLCDTSVSGMNSPSPSHYSMPPTPSTSYSAFDHHMQEMFPVSAMEKSNQTGQQYGLGFEMPSLNASDASIQWSINNVNV